jgi:excisionase family DNA binding protein
MLSSATSSRRENDNASVLIDFEEAAYILNCSRALIYKLVNKEQLKIVKIGRSSKLRRADVLALAGV